MDILALARLATAFSSVSLIEEIDDDLEHNFNNFNCFEKHDFNLSDDEIKKYVNLLNNPEEIYQITLDNIDIIKKDLNRDIVYFLIRYCYQYHLNHNPDANSEVLASICKLLEEHLGDRLNTLIKMIIHIYRVSSDGPEDEEFLVEFMRFFNKINLNNLIATGKVSCPHLNQE